MQSNYILFCLCRGGEAEALKCLIWETVNRIYANLMIPAITGGSTSHFQAAEILLQFLSLRWVFSPFASSIHRLLLSRPVLVDPMMRPEFWLKGDADGLAGDPVLRCFGARCNEICPSASLCDNKPFPSQPHLLVELCKHKCLCPAPA